MKKTITTLLCACIFIFSFAQNENPMTKEKGQRTTTPIDLKDLNPVKIDGRNAQNSNPLPTKELPNLAEPNIEVTYAEDNGMPIQIKGEYSTKRITGLSLNEIEQEAQDFLKRINRTLKINAPELEFIVTKTETDALGITHIHMQQYYMGVKVHAGDIVLHTDKDGKINRMNGRYYPTPEITSSVPVITESAASQNAINDVKTEAIFKELTDKEKSLLNIKQTEARLVVYHNELDIESERLSWHITVRPNVMERWEYFIDAQSGEILFRLNHTCSLDGPTTATAVDLFGISRTINVYEVSNTYYMIDASQSMFDLAGSSLPDDPRGVIWTIDANNTSPQNNLNVSHVTSSNNSWNNPTAVSAHYNAEQSYDYFKNTHNRNSINGNNGRIVSIINVSDQNGGSMDNAFWNGAAIFYGNGGNAFQPLAKGLDVAGHEMSHGIVSNSANLQYSGQSGALNESFADIFGVMIDRDDWDIGDDVANTSAFPTGTMRSMSDPHNGGSQLGDPGFQPRHMNEIYTGSQDNGGVHINSGIVNWAFYKYATAIGKDKAEDVYYRALVNYLTANSQFVDARLAIMQSAEDIFGANSNEVTAAGQAFDDVGILAPSGGGGGGSTGGGSTTVGVIQPGDLPVVDGDEFLLLYDTDFFNTNTLYTFNPLTNNFTALSQTGVLRPPSITDDGSYAVYVGSDNKMYGLQLDNTPIEQIIQSNPVWENVAISKDGNRLAAITTAQDTAVWVYDFVTAQWATFQLYTPTATSNINANDVVYADALEWDHTGEYLMYDAFNRINGFGGQNLEYWDVGVLKAWDNTNNTFGDGQITKLFTNLPNGISIGNPSISKNSPSIVAFDYIDVPQNNFYLIAVNLVDGSVGTIFQNNQLSYPNYNRLDDEIIFNASNNFNDPVLAKIDLAADKINPLASASASILVNDAKWGRWYAQGTRDGASSVSSLDFPYEVDIYPNPVVEQLTIEMDQNTIEYQLEVSNLIGQTLMSKNLTGQVNSISLKDFDNGFYLVKMIIDGKELVTKVIKTN